MPLTAPGLSAAIHGQLNGQPWAAAGSTELQQFCDALAAAIVTYIVANAVVNPLPSMAVAAAPGPVTGFGTIT